MLRFALPTAVAMVAALAPRASADIGGWLIAPTVGTDAPLDVEAGVLVEAPFRLRLSSTIGVMPSPYATGIVDVLEGVGAIKTPVGNLIESSLDSSLVWRTMVGYRPFRRPGFYAMAGYALVALGGGATQAAALEAATGKMLPSSDQGTARAFTLASTLHTLDVEIGWAWQLPHRVVIEAALGGMFTIAASTSIKPDYTPRDPAATAQYTDQAATYLDGIYTSYAFSPTLIVTAGYAL